MTPEEQVKTIMEIFGRLTHEQQVGLFNEVKVQLLQQRKNMHESYSKQIEENKINLDNLLEGTDIISGVRIGFVGDSKPAG